MGKIYEACLRFGIKPNHITISRVFFVVMGIYWYSIGYKWLGFLTIVISWLTDTVDGHFARYTDTESELGKVLDRLLDKVVFVILVIFAIFLGGFNVPESFILAGLPIILFAFLNCFFEVWGVTLIAYQKIFEPKSKGNGAIWVGKNKLIAQAIFSCALFAPDQLIILKPVVLFATGAIGLGLATLSFWYHVKHVSVFKFCSLSLPLIVLFSYLSYSYVVQ